MADVPGKFFSATKVRTGVSPSSAGSLVGETLPPVNPPGSSLNSVGLTMPSAFTVANSPLTSNGTIGVTGAGTVGQYIRGDGSLADFPESSGGGSSVSYYLNGSISQGTIGGVAYKELNKVPVLGAGTNFTINADGYIAQFLTDAGDPHLVEIPGGNWNFETYFSASSSGGTPSFYVELYKYDGTTFTLIASSSTAPEFIAFGTITTPYFSSLAVPTTALTLTDRLAVRFYVTHSGRTITLHTENNTLCQIVTTFTTGLTSLNGLTAQVQNLAVGTSGTDFAIVSATATHTFNLPTASATNRGALSSADWALFTQAYNDKINSAAVTGTTTKTLTLTQQDGGTITASWSDLNTDAVTSVFGRTGAVVAANGDYTTAQVTESGNLYYTDARSRAALSFAAGSGAYNTSTGVITIPTNNNQITNGAGYITSAALAGYLPLTGGTLTGPLGGTTISLSGDITANRYRGVNSLVLNSYTTVNPSSNVYLYSPPNDRDAWIYLDSADTGSNWGIYHRQIDSAVSGLPANSIGFVGAGSSTLQAWISLANGNGYFAGSLTAANLSGTNTGDVTIGTANGLSLSGQALSLGLASGSANGALSSTDWTTFNNKQNALTLTTTGTSGAATLVGATLNIPQYQAAGTYVTSVTASSPLFSSGGTTPNITIQQASGSQSGFLSSTDWTTFNNKQNALTNPVTGTGNTNYLAKFTSNGSTIGNSNLINDASGNLGLGVTPSAWSTSNDVKAFQLGGDLVIWRYGTAPGSIYFGSNYYWSGTNRIYLNSGFASEYVQTESKHIWNIAPSGTAGNAISFTQAMTLDASGNLLIGALSNISSARREIVIRGANGSLLSLGNNTTADRFQIVSDSGENAILNNKASTPMIFNTSNTEAVRIFSGQNVHIGPTPPSDNGARLQVSGTATFSGGINPTKDAKNTYGIHIRGAFYGAPRLQVYDLNADPNGYMGLGTDMSGAPYELSNYFPRIGANGRWSVGSWAGNFGAGQYVSGYNEKLFINESAAQFNTNLGIGVSPATNLHVNGASVSYGQIRFLNSSSSGEASIHIGRTNQTLEQRWTIGQGVAGIGDSFGFYTGGSSRVSLQTNGNVLIGTTTDNGNKLRVNGVGFFDTGVKTGQPYGTTADVWKLGRALVAGSTTVDRWIRVQIGGEYYDLLSNYGGVVPT